MYKLARRYFPYVPPMEGHGPGCAVPWPHLSMLSVGYTCVPECLGNLEIVNPDKYGNPDGGRWEIITTWQTGWMAIRSLITGEVIFSVPPGTLVPIHNAD